jgi:hypothetical protein
MSPKLESRSRNDVDQDQRGDCRWLTRPAWRHASYSRKDGKIVPVFGGGFGLIFTAHRVKIRVSVTFAMSTLD